MSGADNQSAFNLFDDTICVSASDKSAAASLLSVYNYSPDRQTQTRTHTHTLTHAQSSPILRDYTRGGKG